MSIIIDTVADPTVHLVTVDAGQILSAAEPGTAATSPTRDPHPDLGRPFAVDTPPGLNSSSGPSPCFLLIRYAPAHQRQISSSVTCQTRTVGMVVHPSH